jgi:hypothetical protein
VKRAYLEPNVSKTANGSKKYKTNEFTAISGIKGNLPRKPGSASLQLSVQNVGPVCIAQPQSK